MLNSENSNSELCVTETTLLELPWFLMIAWKNVRFNDDDDDDDTTTIMMMAITEMTTNDSTLNQRGRLLKNLWVSNSPSLSPFPASPPFPSSLPFPFLSLLLFPPLPRLRLKGVGERLIS